MARPTIRCRCSTPISTWTAASRTAGSRRSRRPTTRTLVITTSEPIVTLSQMYIPMLPKHIWEDDHVRGRGRRDPVHRAVDRHRPVQDGRVRTRSRRSCSRPTTPTGPGAPHIDQLVYQFFDNDEAQVKALITGEVDFLDNFPPTLAQTLMERRERRPSTSPELGLRASWASTAGRPHQQRFVDEGCADCPKGPTTGSMGDPWLTRAGGARRRSPGLLDKQALIEQARQRLRRPGRLGRVAAQPDYSATRRRRATPSRSPSTPTRPARPDGPSHRRAAIPRRHGARIGFTDTDGDGILNVPDTRRRARSTPRAPAQNWSPPARSRATTTRRTSSPRS